MLTEDEIKMIMVNLYKNHIDILSNDMIIDFLKLIKYLFDRIELTPGCWLWRGPLCTGKYKYGSFHPSRKLKQKPVHRLMYQIFFGLIDDNIVIRHTCDNTICVNPLHLESGTHVDNVQDRVKRNRSAIGERNGRHKLKEAQVREIKCNQVLSINDLSEIYGVDKAVIRRIKSGDAWKHVA